ncbi:ABC-2 type transport system permease protein [Paenibacillus shirakamiensis]|uniref:ABC-2 type transport system permease protein n=1 Tax=Paenibacillus shirakamiensis TaxID=1265935 RepID=A0ABS4JJ15_9BACL|nr:ABC transporter permease [Paenibacillus shirakamiensis]MBP2001687.1 ABC-2 type transport system permease protein [Paenibacillus shirakamiensis]
MMKKKEKTPIAALFRQRIRSHIGKQYSVIRSAVDFIVVIYIMIPGAFILGCVYFDKLHHVPNILYQVPFSVFISAIMICLYFGGGLILYTESADVLFLRQNPNWRKGLMQRAIVANVVMRSIEVLGVMALFIPFIRTIFHMPVGQCIWIGILILLYRCAGVTIQHHLRVYYSAWKRIGLILMTHTLLIGMVLLACSMVGKWSSVTLAISIIFLTVTVVLLRKITTVNGHFYEEVLEDERQKNRLTSWMLSSSVDKPSPVRARPLWFRQSQHLFRSTTSSARMASILIKSFLRSGPFFKMYIQFIIFGGVSCFVAPFPIDIMVGIAIILLMAYWIRSYVRLFENTDLMRILPTHRNFRRAHSIVLFTLLAPTMFVWVMSIILSILLG